MTLESLNTARLEVSTKVPRLRIVGEGAVVNDLDDVTGSRKTADL